MAKRSHFYIYSFMVFMLLLQTIITPLSVFSLDHTAAEAKDNVISQVEIEAPDSELTKGTYQWEVEHQEFFKGDKVKANLPEGYEVEGQVLLDGDSDLIAVNITDDQVEMTFEEDVEEADHYQGTITLPLKNLQVEADESEDNSNNLETSEQAEEAETETEAPAEEAKSDKQEAEQPSKKQSSIKTFSSPENLGSNIFKDVKLLLDGQEISEDDTIVIEDGTELVMELSWELDDEIDLQAGDYAELELPKAFDQSSLRGGKLLDGDIEVGEFKFDGHKLIVTFNEELVDQENRQGAIGFSLKFDLTEFDTELEQEIEFEDPINKTFKVKTYPDGIDIEKRGKVEVGANPKFIDWTITVNTNLTELEAAKVFDDIPQGLEIVEDSFEFFELKVNRDGSIADAEKVEGIQPTITENGFTVDFGDTNKAYEIKYTTKITDYDVDGYLNKVKLTADNQDEKTATAEIEKISQEPLIEKTGSIDANPKHIDWTIDINKAEMSLINAVVKDEIPAGLILDEIEIYELNFEKGQWQTGKKLEDEFELDDFPIEFGDIDQAYRIKVKTKIDLTAIDFKTEGEVKETFKNEAFLFAEEGISEHDDDSVTASWEELVKKDSKDVTAYGDHELEWTVELNNPGLTIHHAKFIDIIGEGQELIPGSVKVIGSEITAEDIKTSDFNFNEWNLDCGDINPDDISFGIDLGTITEPIKITYRVKVTAQQDKYENEAHLFGIIANDGEGSGEGPGDDLIPYLESHKTSGKRKVFNNYQKAAKDIDYKEKTMSWEVTVDAIADEIKNLTITDDFDPEKSMFLLEGTLKINTKDDKLIKGTDYEVTDNGVEGFKIEFIGDHKPLKRAKYTIAYETSFDPNDVLAKDGILNGKREYKNIAQFTGEADKEINEKHDAKQTLIEWISKKGKKEGQINRDKRQITWQVYTNALGQDLSGSPFKIHDTLSDGHTVVEGSIKAYSYSLNSKGKIVKGEELTDYDDLTISDDDTSFDMNFGNGIDQPVMVEYTSQINGISKDKYKNTANVEHKDYEGSYSKTIDYDDHNKFANKNSDVSGATVYTDEEIEWTATVNESLSEIENAVFKDTMSDGLILINDSIMLDGEPVLPGSDELKIVKNDDGTTTIELKLGQIDGIHNISYKTVVVASDGKVSNKASLFDNKTQLGSESTKEYQARSSSWGTGQGNEKRGNIKISKVDDEGNPIKIPAQFKLYYLLNGEEQIVTGALQETENGELIYANLPFRTYYLEETEAPEGYELTIDTEEIELNSKNRDIEKRITNRELVSVEGKKTWQEVDQDFRPESIMVQLFANDDDQALEEVEVSNTNGWQYTFDNLYKFDKEGKAITYSVKETTPPGYEAKYDGFNILNTQKQTELKGQKIWKEVDSDYRPESITVDLYANDEPYKGMSQKVTANDDWKYSFEELPKYNADGKEINYEVREKALTGYTTEYEGNNIINTQKETVVEGEKTWDEVDADYRPESITVELYANGEPYQDMSQDVTANDDWKYSFKGLPQYDASGEEINYTVKEVAMNGYEASYDGFDITNTQKVKTISGEKTWDEVDADYRPESITVSLLVDDEVYKNKTVTVEVDDAGKWQYSFEKLPVYDAKGHEIEYTIEEAAMNGYTAIYDGNNIENKQVTIDMQGEKTWQEVDSNYRPESITVELYANGKPYKEMSQEVTDDHDWEYAFKDLPKFDAAGEEINYTVKEVPMNGYGASYDGFDVTNTQKTQIISGEKTWDEVDADYRPESITVSLLVDGEVYKDNKVTVEANEKGEWQYSFKNLPVYDAAGNEIEYTIEEDVMNGYEASYDGFDITNTQEVKSISGEKTWDDVDPDYRPASITVQLLANGKVYQEVETNADNDWAYDFDDLPVYDALDKEIDYTVEEVEMKAYEVEYDGFNIINKQNTKAIAGEKTWDEVDSDYRPESITVKLLANGLEYKSVETNADNDWAYDFQDLPVYDALDNEIDYTVEEVFMDAYKASYDDDYNIDNKQVTIDLNGQKIWQDVTEKYRPEHITVNLLANGEVYKTQSVSAEQDWSFTFTQLPKYDQNDELIDYSLEEMPVHGYTSIYHLLDQGYLAITNQQTLTEINIDKIWQDENNKTYRPDHITFVVKIADEIVTEKEFPVDINKNQANYTIDQLPKYDQNGQEIEYLLEEKAVEAYEAKIENEAAENVIKYNVTNELIKGDFELTKTDSADGKRLANAKIVIKDANGDVVRQDKTNQAGMVYFNDLDYGKYTYQETEAPKGYELDETEYAFEVTEMNQVLEVTMTNDLLPDEDHGDVTANDGSDSDHQLPKTATNHMNYLLGGLGLIIMGALMLILIHRRGNYNS